MLVAVLVVAVLVVAVVVVVLRSTGPHAGLRPSPPTFLLLLASCWPQAIPVASTLAVLSLLAFIVAFWPVWGWLTIPAVSK